MNEKINILRLGCLLQDRDNQDFKRVVLSLIFEFIYENNNQDLFTEDIYKAIVNKSNEPIERDFFEGLIANSKSFVLTNSDNDTLVRLTPEKFNNVEKSISEFSIEPSIINFLAIKDYEESLKDVIINILYQSIYENIYAFNPSKIDSLVPDVIKLNFEQKELDLFNEFLEFDDPIKNRRLYNQFVKAIEFAILTSGKGVKKFTESIYADKVYILDTNIIFRMIGVGGEERQETINKLIESCIRQGVKFEYTLNTYQELSITLEGSINKISKAEQTRKVEIIQELIAEAPHFFNDDFIIQYSRLKNERKISSPEQYALELKARFKKLCTDYSIEQANHNIKLEPHEIGIFANKLISERKKITSYKYSLKQAKVDAFNVLYVRKCRGNNNFNYSDVKSFYLTTDRGLNKILSDSPEVVIPATILPSQLFAIHNPLTGDSEGVDYENFFRFIKRRTSEFKHRGRDVFSFIQQAQVYTTDKDEIKELIIAFTDGRYSSSKDEAVNENVLIKFKDFAKTYFDHRLLEIENIESNHNEIESNGLLEQKSTLLGTKLLVKSIDFFFTAIIIPLIALLIGLITNWIFLLISFITFEGIKFWQSKKENFNKRIWEYFFVQRMKRKPYFKLTKNEQFIKKGLMEIEQINGNVWKKS